MAFPKSRSFIMKLVKKSIQLALCAVLLFSTVPSQAMGNGLRNIADSIYKSVANCSLFNAIKDHHPKIALACTAGAALFYLCRPLDQLLLHAARGNNTKTVKLLVKLGADVNVKDNCGFTALMQAAMYSETESVQALTKVRANLNHQDNDGQTALMWAAAKGRKDVVQILINARANINLQDNNGQTALMRATMPGETESVQALIKANADVNIKDNAGQTALMWAAMYGETESVQALIKARANLNHQDNDGKTALMWAAELGRKDVVQILIDAGRTAALMETTPKIAQILSKKSRRRENNEEKIKQAKKNANSLPNKIHHLNLELNNLSTQIQNQINALGTALDIIEHADRKRALDKGPRLQEKLANILASNQDRNNIQEKQNKLQKELQKFVTRQRQLDIPEELLRLAQNELKQLTENLQKIPSFNNEEQQKIADLQRKLHNLADQERQYQERFTRTEVQLTGAQLDLDAAKEGLCEFLN